MALPKNVDKYLSRRYYDHKLPGSYTSASKLHDVIKSEGKYSIPLKRIQRWAEGQDILTLHKTVRQRQPVYRRVIVPGIGHLWDADLMVLNGERFVRENRGYAYVLVTIDAFSKFVRARPVKNKGGKEMVRAFEEIFDSSTTLPRFCRSDKGTEFSNRPVQELFKKRGIRHYYANTESKAHLAERVIKTIKRKLFQFFQRNNSYSYWRDLQGIVDSYNSTFHRTIGRSPEQVTEANSQEVWDYQYVKHSKTYLNSIKRALKDASKPSRRRNAGDKRRFKYSVGQTVRVAYFKSKPFDRAYDEQFTGEVFTIRKRDVIENVPVYYLNDYNGEEVKGQFYEGEITPVKFDPNALFKIEKVLKKRVRNGVEESYVKFLSWGNSHNQWLPSSSLVPLRKGRGRRRGKLPVAKGVRSEERRKKEKTKSPSNSGGNDAKGRNERSLRRNLRKRK